MAPRRWIIWGVVAPAVATTCTAPSHPVTRAGSCFLKALAGISAGFACSQIGPRGHLVRPRCLTPYAWWWRGLTFSLLRATARPLNLRLHVPPRECPEHPDRRTIDQWAAFWTSGGPGAGRCGTASPAGRRLAAGARLSRRSPALSGRGTRAPPPCLPHRSRRLQWRRGLGTVL